MKTLQGCFTVFFAIFYLMGCSEQYQIRKVITFPESISPIYYIDTIQIVSPRVAMVDSIPYIFSKPRLLPVEDKEEFIMQKGVARYLTPDLHFFRVTRYVNIYKPGNWRNSFDHLARQNDFYFNDLFLPDESIGEIPVYKFAFEPKTFLLTLISPIDSIITPEGDDSFFLDILFSKEYFIAVVPIYNNHDLRKINKLYLRRLNEAQNPKHSEVKDTIECNIFIVGETKRNIDSLLFSDVALFLQTFSDKCRNNVEFSQLSNVLLFRVLEKYPEEVVNSFDNNEQLNIDYILSELSNPLHDINLAKLVEILVNMESESQYKAKIISALEKVS